MILSYKNKFIFLIYKFFLIFLLAIFKKLTNKKMRKNLRVTNYKISVWTINPTFLRKLISTKNNFKFKNKKSN